MNKRRPIIIGVVLVLIVILGIKVFTQPTQKERQIAFLKEHEEEMVAFIKKNSSEDEDITFQWDAIETGPFSAFSEPVILLKFDISNSSKHRYNGSGHTLGINTDLKKLKKINKLSVLDRDFYLTDEEDKDG